MDARIHYGHGRFGNELNSCIQSMDDVFATARHWLTDEAEQLVVWFRKERKRIQEGLKDPSGRLPRGLFAPLNLNVKGGGDRPLELYWSKRYVGRGGKANRSIYLEKGKGTLYSESDLIKVAKPYEILLVLEAEEKAEVIRRRWKWVVDCQKAIKRLDIDVFAKAKFGQKFRTRVAMGKPSQGPADDSLLAKLVADGHMEFATSEDLLPTHMRFKKVNGPDPIR